MCVVDDHVDNVIPINLIFFKVYVLLGLFEVVFLHFCANGEASSVILLYSTIFNRNLIH